MSIKDFAVFVAVGAAIFGFVHNNTVAVTTWLRQAAIKLVHWVTTEAEAGVTDVESLFKKKAVVVAVPAAAAAASTVLAASIVPKVVTTASGTQTVNGVAVPTGLTVEQFVSLILATSGVSGFLSSTASIAEIIGASQAWYSSLGTYFREELLAQTAANPKLSAVAQAVAALQAGCVLPLQSITAAQQAAANSAL